MLGVGGLPPSAHEWRRGCSWRRTVSVITTAEPSKEAFRHTSAPPSPSRALTAGPSTRLQFAGAAYVGRDDGQQAADLAQLLLLARFCDQRCGEGAETEPLQEFCTRDAAGTSRNARSGPVAQGLGGRGRGSGMPCMLCLSWIRHLPSNACSVFFWCRASGVATTVRRAARQEGLGKSNEAAQGEEHERQELEKECNEARLRHLWWCALLS